MILIRCLSVVAKANFSSTSATISFLNISSRAKTMLRTEIEKTYSPDELFEFNLIYCDAMVQNVMKKIGELH